ncbi:MAG TPA: FAD-dependent oxidoreductase [Nocardioides sp.]|nr:FAD-dependent oxidoreductase [Nocardioides sp.]
MTRVVVAGLGDTGLLTAIHLAQHRDLEVVGISSQPGLVSGQELGTRLARPDDWQRDYRIAFERYRALDRVRVRHAEVTGLDLAARTVRLRDAERHDSEEPYDVLVIATGVRNGFWRTPDLRTADEVTADLATAHARLADSATVLVVGGGAASVGSALQLALRWPDKRISLAFPGERGLPQHHLRTWTHAARRLEAAGVELLAGRRAVVPDDAEAITSGPVSWQTAHQPTKADAVLWAIGRTQPNTAWLPQELLDEHGFVRVTPTLQLPTSSGVFAIGDVAATDPLRASARSRADKLLARNIRAHLAGRSLQTYRAPRHRWGSVLGVEPDGLRVFAPDGRPYRFPRWTVDTLLQRWIVRRGIYRGVRD